MRLLLALLLLAPACAASPAPDVEAPQVAAQALPAAPPAPVTPVPEDRQAGLVCSVGACHSGVHVTIHLAAAPSELAARGAFGACYQGECWNGTFANATSADAWPCALATSPAPASRCVVHAEGTGSVMHLFVFVEALAGHDGKTVTDGDRVSVRVTDGGRVVTDTTRTLSFLPYWSNGPLCDGTCMAAATEIWSGPPATVVPSDSSLALEVLRRFRGDWCSSAPDRQPETAAHYRRFEKIAGAPKPEEAEEYRMDLWAVDECAKDTEWRTAAIARLSARIAALMKR